MVSTVALCHLMVVSMYSSPPQVQKNVKWSMGVHGVPCDGEVP